MENYKLIADRFVDYHEKTVRINKEIKAVTQTLIGAIGLGFDVKYIEYDKSSINSVDLSFNIDLFNKSGLSVDDLEYMLFNLYESYVLNLKYFEHEKNQLIQHFNFCPNAFLHKYISIPMDVLLNSEDTKDTTKFLAEFRTSYLLDNKTFSFIVDNNNLKVFFKNDEDLSYVKHYFSKKNTFIKYNILKFKLEYDVDYLGYLFI